MANKKQGRRKKHVPQRTCVGCHSVQEKRSLIRIVRTPEGVYVDADGKLSGRGAYLHDQAACWEKALQKGILAKALRTELKNEDVKRLTDTLETLSEVVK